MTFHVALASPAGAVMISDSQGSTAASESHGFQKQIAGDGYLLGLAGSMAVINVLLRELATGQRLNNGVPPTAADVEGIVTRFIETELQPSAAASIQAVFASFEGQDYRVRTHIPALFRHFGHPSLFGTIGSGSEFAQRAISRDLELGIQLLTHDIVALFTSAESLADAANESLTVDDQLVVGLLRNGKSYQMWHADVRAAYAPPQIVAHRLIVSQHFEILRSQAQALRAELREAYRLFSTIRSTPLSALTLHQLAQSSVGIQQTKARMAQQFDTYCAWYDGLLNR